MLESSRQAKLARAEAAGHDAASHPAEQTDKATQTDKADKKALRAEQRAEKRAVDEAIEEAREEDLLTQIRHAVLRIRPQAPSSRPGWSGYGRAR